MVKTKSTILVAALGFYNQNGVANTSIRQLAREVNISHSNLIYHFPTQEDIIEGLHDLLLERAIQLNSELNQDKSSMIQLFETTKIGFSVVYDFRFLFLELYAICKTYPRIKHLILSVEQIRSEMYDTLIKSMISSELIRNEENREEYARLINLIKIFSDHWLESSFIYDPDLSREEKINKYSFLLMTYFYPYLKEKGKEEFQLLIELAHERN